VETTVLDDEADFALGLYEAELKERGLWIHT
jgi:hypothetical protein